MCRRPGQAQGTVATAGRFYLQMSESREQGLTTTLTEVIFYNEGIYFFALSPGSCLVVVSRLSFLIDPGAAGCVVGSLLQRQLANRQR